MALTALEYDTMLKTIAEQEYAEGGVYAVGAGSTNGLENTNELKVMKYEAAMEGTNKVKWEMTVQEEYHRFKGNKCFEEMRRNRVGPGKKIMTSTWAMKMKSSGNFRARLNAWSMSR